MYVLMDNDRVIKYAPYIEHPNAIDVPTSLTNTELEIYFEFLALENNELVINSDFKKGLGYYGLVINDDNTCRLEKHYAYSKNALLLKITTNLEPLEVYKRYINEISDNLVVFKNDSNFKIEVIDNVGRTIEII